ncbi:hypothetical protein [Blastococcus sp. SYSU DS1024]
MADVYMYVDETGNLDLTGGPGASPYFGIGTAVFSGDHAQSLWEGAELRFEMERAGHNMPRGFHAVEDNRHAKEQVFDLIRKQGPRFDSTFLEKSRAYPRVIQSGEVYFYKLAWFQHFKYVAPQITSAGDRLHVVAATLGTAARKTAVRAALEDVVAQVMWHREVTLCGGTARRRTGCRWLTTDCGPRSGT